MESKVKRTLHTSQWVIAKVKQCFKFRNGKGFSGVLKSFPDEEFCHPVYGGNGIIGYSDKYLLEEPTIIVGRVGEYCGNVFKTQNKSWVTDNAMMVCDILLEDYDIDFWVVMLNSLSFNHYSDSTGQPKITQGGIGAISFKYPSEKEEQTAIANILSKVDKAIASVQNSIAAAERLKKSLMQNLLTGKMKPDGTFRTSEEFYIDENFGKVPVGWEVKRGTEITTKITKGQSPKWQGFDYQQEGILFVTSENIQNGYIDISKPKYLPLEFNNKIRNSQLEKGDILINIVGASIGRCAIFNIDIECANINQAVCVFRPDAENDSMFLSLYLQSETTQNRLFRTQVETARANLSLGDFRKFKFVIPQKEEQIKIANRINLFDIEREKLIERILVLERLKKSLMQNLLTGKVTIIR